MCARIVVLDRLEDLLGEFDARAGRRAHMQLDQPGIDAREEIGADKFGVSTPAPSTIVPATAAVVSRRRRMPVSSQA